MTRPRAPLSVRIATHPRRTRLAFAVIAATSVSVPYLPLPILGLVSQDLDLTATDAAVVAMAAPLGYALGILLLVPASDVLPPRRQLVATLALSALALGAVGVADGAVAVSAGLFLAGVLANSAQLVARIGVAVADPAASGGTVAAVGAGVLAGIFGGRVVISPLAEAFGWRAGILAMAGLIGVTAILAWSVVGAGLDRLGRRGYRRAMSSLPRLVAAEPGLRRAGAHQGLLFVSFSAVWSVIALALTSSPLDWSVGAAGMVGLLGVVGIPIVLAAGRVIDAGRTRALQWTSTVGAVLGCALVGSASTIAVILLVGLALLTYAAQISQVGHQARILSTFGPRAGQANTAFLSIVLVGGAVGTGLGAAAFAAGGMPAAAGVGVVSAVLATLALDPARRRRA